MRFQINVFLWNVQTMSVHANRYRTTFFHTNSDPWEYLGEMQILRAQKPAYEIWQLMWQLNFVRFEWQWKFVTHACRPYSIITLHNERYLLESRV